MFDNGAKREEEKGRLDQMKRKARLVYYFLSIKFIYLLIIILVKFIHFLSCLYMKILQKKF